MYRHSNNKRVVLAINIKNDGSLVKVIKEFIAHLTSPPKITHPKIDSQTKSYKMHTNMIKINLSKPRHWTQVVNELSSERIVRKNPSLILGGNNFLSNSTYITVNVYLSLNNEPCIIFLYQYPLHVNVVTNLSKRATNS
jgi:hypothetical protein